MDWNAIGAIAEVSGTVAVVFSVLYLAVQVKQSRISTSLETVQRVSSGFTDFWKSISDSKELADVYYRGMQDMDKLDEVERVQLIVLLSRVMRVLHDMHYQRQLGVVDDVIWDNFLRPYIDAFQLDGFQKWWSLRRHWYPRASYLNRREHG